MKKLLLMTTLFSASLVSCGYNEFEQMGSRENEVDFSPYTSNNSEIAYFKGTLTDNTSIKASGFGVFGYFHDSSEPSYSKDGEPNFSFGDPNFMDDQQVLYSEATKLWEYRPPKYWSGDSEDKYSFFGYAPRSGYGNISLERSPGLKGAPEVSFNINSNASEMEDFVAGQSIAISKADGIVNINLKHQLTRVTFSARTNTTDNNGDSPTRVIVKSMEIKSSNDSEYPSKGFYSGASYVFPTDESSDNDVLNHNQDGEWTNPRYELQRDYEISSLLAQKNQKIGNYPANTGVEIKNNDSYKSVFIDDEYLFLIPPFGKKGIPGDNSKDIYVEIEYDIVTEDAALSDGCTYSENKVVIALPSQTLQQGKAYVYQITFGLDRVTLRPDVVDWDDNISSEDIDIETSAIPSKI